MRTVSEDVFIGTRSGAPERYPYDEMSDGKPHVLVRGEDFDETVEVANVITAVRKGFRKRGLRIRSKVLNADEAAIQVTGKL